MRVKFSAVSAMLFSASIACAQNINGRVVSIADGDTITLLDSANVQHRIRLAGIDAPEKKQAFGNVSKRHMSDLAFGKAANADCYKTDRYGRLICIVSVGGRDVGLAQLEAGLAWVYQRYIGELHPSMQLDYQSAEDKAAADRVGLWRDLEPIPPWEWRHNAVFRRQERRPES